MIRNRRFGRRAIGRTLGAAAVAALATAGWSAGDDAPDASDSRAAASESRAAALGAASPAALRTTPAAVRPLADRQAWICGAAAGAPDAPSGPHRLNRSAMDPRAPWAVKLEIVEERFDDGAMTVSNCSAAAIAPEWLLTAAHCVGQEGWISVEATLGARDADAPEALRRSAAYAICHERFDPKNLAYDLALLKLDAPLPPEFPLLRMATSGESNRLKAGAAALSAGWGRVAGDEISSTLRTSAVRVVDPDHGGGGVIVAAPTRHEGSLCVGESGAALVADLGGGPALFGVFSSVDAYYSRRSGGMVELCHGFEARSYFTALRGLRRWVEQAIAACEEDPAGCARQ